MKNFIKVYLVTTSYGLLWVIALYLKEIFNILKG